MKWIIFGIITVFSAWLLWMYYEAEMFNVERCRGLDNYYEKIIPGYERMTIKKD